jgi:hypothetical protein
VAATALALTSTGDALVLAVVLGLGAFDLAAAVAALLVAGGLLARLGTSALPAAAGAQSVLGPAGLVGPPLAATSAWCGAAAAVLAAPSGWGAVPFGLTAGLLVCGPSAALAGPAGARILAGLVGVGLAVAVGSRLPRGVGRALAVAAGVASLVTGLAARPQPWRWAGSVRGGALQAGVGIAVAAGAIAFSVVRLRPLLRGEPPAPAPRAAQP